MPRQGKKHGSSPQPAYARRDRRPVERFVAGHTIEQADSDVDESDNEDGTSASGGDVAPLSPASAAFGEQLIPDDVFVDLLDRAKQAP